MSLKNKFKKEKDTQNPEIKKIERKTKGSKKMDIIESINKETEILKTEEPETKKDVKKIEKEFIIFEIDNNYFGIELEYAREVLELQYITPVPLTKDFFLGLINVRNEIVAVVDLYNILLNKSVPHNKSNRMLLLNASDKKCCIIINRIVEIYGASEDEIIKNFENIEFQYKEFVKAILNYKEKKVPVIDVEKLFKSEIFNEVEE